MPQLCTEHQRRRTRRNRALILFLILAVAAVARLGAVLWLPTSPTFTDGKTYDRAAEHIIRHKAYPLYSHSNTPLYPLVLAGLYSQTGVNGTAARLGIEAGMSGREALECM